MVGCIIGIPELISLANGFCTKIRSCLPPASAAHRGFCVSLVAQLCGLCGTACEQHGLAGVLVGWDSPGVARMVAWCKSNACTDTCNTTPINIQPQDSETCRCAGYAFSSSFSKSVHFINPLRILETSTESLCCHAPRILSGTLALKWTKPAQMQHVAPL